MRRPLDKLSASGMRCWANWGDGRGSWLAPGPPCVGLNVHTKEIAKPVGIEYNLSQLDAVGE